MNYTTVEYLEQKTVNKRFKHKVISFFNEIKTVAAIFIFVFFGMIVFTNAKLFMNNIGSVLTTSNVPQNPLTENTIYQDNSIASVIEAADQKSKEVESMIEKYKQEGLNISDLSLDSKSELQSNLKTYDFKFNTLPPTNRLIVPSLGVNDPLITSKYMELKDFTNGNFDEELKMGVVKYPTTPEPGKGGNTLIFGHTSQERWKYNNYGMAFAHITKLKMGDIVQVVRNGKLFEYKIIDVVVVYPQHVNEVYMKYENLDKSYLTLMGCYPIGKATQRMLVIAEEVSNNDK